MITDSLKDSRDVFNNQLAVLAKEDKSALQLLISTNWKYAEWAIRRWGSRAIRTGWMPDLEQQARLAFMRAVQLYEPNRCKFSYFLSFHLHSFIYQFTVRNAECVKSPFIVGRGNKRYRAWAKSISIDSSTSNRWDDSEIKIIDLLRSDDDLEEDLDDRTRAELCKRICIELLTLKGSTTPQLLPVRWIQFLCDRFANDASLEIAGSHLGITREGARLNEANALNKCKTILRPDKASTFDEFLLLAANRLSVAVPDKNWLKNHKISTDAAKRTRKATRKTAASRSRHSMKSTLPRVPAAP